MKRTLSATLSLMVGSPFQTVISDKTQLFFSSQMMHSTLRRQDVVVSPLNPTHWWPAGVDAVTGEKAVAVPLTSNRRPDTPPAMLPSLPLLLTHTELADVTVLKHSYHVFPWRLRFHQTLLSAQGKVSSRRMFYQTSASLPVSQILQFTAVSSREKSAEGISETLFAEGFTVTCFWQVPGFQLSLLCWYVNCNCRVSCWNSFVF